MNQLSAAREEARAMVCLPLDGLDTLHEVRERLELLGPFVGIFKVGKESFTRFGPAVLEQVHRAGSGVFLDLKYHDIPNTVRGAARAAAELGVSLFNVHASGGRAMMAAAREGAESAAGAGRQRPKIVAVTVLTSIDEEILNTECGVPGDLDTQVVRLARLSAGAGLDGIVCSALDLATLRPELDPGFIYVTPGIRGTTTPAGEDQKRVMSPGRAVAAGSSLLVIGRAITAAADPAAAALEVLDDIAASLAQRDT